ncbi:unnamed protein product [Brachionus calyciflorus]|uniref:Uncharacterized protein n=1 Tax=Brachionus calyciflorus TaxID=104777 RepID=A0A814HK04_9BILA|nr:unnamed protein product [Brachionus calyciflorus]
MLEIISNSCADDTKILSIIKNFDSIFKLQNDLDNVCKWSKDWSAELNVDKCKITHIGNNNTKIDYMMESETLNLFEKDLGIYIQSDLKWDTQIKYANRVLGCIRKSFKFPQSERIKLKLLYTSIVRPQLEYVISPCSPFLEKDIKELERVQRRATKLVPELRNLEYHERLSKMNLTNLKTRRFRDDLIQIYKIINGLECINLQKGINFNLNCSGSLRKYNFRRHSQTLVRELVKNCSSRLYFLTNRIVNHCNQLPNELIEARNINCLKPDEWLSQHMETTAKVQ